MNFFLSVSSMRKSYIKWSTVGFPPSQGHSGDCVILYRCKYALVLTCSVVIAVKFGVNLNLVFNQSLKIGEKLVCC